MLLAGGGVAVALAAVAGAVLLRVWLLGAQPAELSVAAATESASRRAAWVHLVDGRFACNELRPGDAEVRVVAGPAGTRSRVVAPLGRDGSCPPRASVVGRLAPRRGDATLVLAPYDRANELAFAAVAGGFAALALLTGGLGHLQRFTRRNAAKRAATASIPQADLTAALRRRPLRLRSRVRLFFAGSVAAALILLGLMGFTTLSRLFDALDEASYAFYSSLLVSLLLLVVAATVGRAMATRTRRVRHLLEHGVPEPVTFTSRRERYVEGALAGYDYTFVTADGRVHDASLGLLAPASEDAAGNGLALVGGLDEPVLLVAIDGSPFEIPPDLGAGRSRNESQ